MDPSIDQILKRWRSKPARFLCILCLAFWVAAPPASAQSPPSLEVKLPAGQPTLSLKGEPGTIYSIQYATGLSPTNQWTDRTLLRAQADGVEWRDPSAPVAEQRFYRAVSVPAPADTNLVFIPPGTFLMGSPLSEAERYPDERQHQVTISRGFWMGKYEVTQAEYLAVVGSNPSYFNGDRSDESPPYDLDYGTDLTRPVDQVSWIEATNYCALRTQQERAAGLFPTNQVYRLPTESEWEYACRAGTTTAFYLGSGLYSEWANFDGPYEYDAAKGGSFYEPSGVYLEQTTPVGSYDANDWGLYDMIGNLWEWCQDWYGPYPTGPVTDPQGVGTGTGPVGRGGSWYEYAGDCRSACRGGYSDDLTSKYGTGGLRVVLALIE